MHFIPTKLIKRNIYVCFGLIKLHRRAVQECLAVTKTLIIGQGLKKDYKWILKQEKKE